MVGRIARLRGLAPHLLALVLVFRLLVPAGFMISPDHSGLVFCSAPAPSGEAAHHDGHSAAPAKAGDGPCPYAAMAAPPLPPAPPMVFEPAPASAAPPIAPAAQSDLSRGLAAPPPPATGPPLPA
jgi:hypothetical protein